MPEAADPPRFPRRQTQRTNGRRWASIPVVATYAVAGLLGIGLALFVFPLAFLFPVSPAPGPFPDGALAQHAIGQRYFIADAWRRPLLMVPSLGAPHGVNIGLTDSIPLIALILKAFSSWLPPVFTALA